MNDLGIDLATRPSQCSGGLGCVHRMGARIISEFVESGWSGDMSGSACGMRRSIPMSSRSNQETIPLGSSDPAKNPSITPCHAQGSDIREWISIRSTAALVPGEHRDKTPSNKHPFADRKPCLAVQHADSELVPTYAIVIVTRTSPRINPDNPQLITHNDPVCPIPHAGIWGRAKYYPG